MLCKESLLRCSNGLKRSSCMYVASCYKLDMGQYVASYHASGLVSGLSITSGLLLRSVQIRAPLDKLFYRLTKCCIESHIEGWIVSKQNVRIGRVKLSSCQNCTYD